MLSVFAGDQGAGPGRKSSRSRPQLHFDELPHKQAHHPLTMLLQECVELSRLGRAELRRIPIQFGQWPSLFSTLCILRAVYVSPDVSISVKHDPLGVAPSRFHSI